MVLSHYLIWSHFRFLIMECCYNQNWSSSVGQSVPSTTYLTDAGLWVRVSKGVTCHMSGLYVFLRPHMCAYDEGVSSGGKWMIAVPNVDLMWLLMPFTEKVFEVWLRPSDLTCGLYLHRNTSQIYWLLWNRCKHEPLCHLSQAIWLSL